VSPKKGWSTNTPQPVLQEACQAKLRTLRLACGTLEAEQTGGKRHRATLQICRTMSLFGSGGIRYVRVGEA